MAYRGEMTGFYRKAMGDCLQAQGRGMHGYGNLEWR